MVGLVLYRKPSAKQESHRALGVDLPVTLWRTQNAMSLSKDREKHSYSILFKRIVYFLFMCIWGGLYLSDLAHQKTMSDPMKLVF